MFLKYQCTVCTETNAPLSHVIPIFLLTWIVGSFKYMAIYIVSILYILLTVYLTHKFPDSFGSRYISFLKRHSSPEAFKKYCGNPLETLKTIIKNPEFINVVMKNGFSKMINCVGISLIFEDSGCKFKAGQLYRYKMEQYMNNGQHPSGQPFTFKPNGPSVLESLVFGKNDRPGT